MSSPATFAALLLVAISTSAPPARAQPGAAPPPATDAHEPPLAPRLFHVPTAWLQPPAQIFASAGVNHRGSGLLAAAIGIGQLAEIDSELTDRFVDCATACDGDERDPRAAWVVSALFKVGIAERRLAWWQPALALGFRRSLHSPGGAGPGDSELGLAEVYAAASVRIGSLQVHVGGELWDASSPEARLDTSASVRLRPFAGLGWRPPIYPRTTLIGDFGWVPELPIRATMEELRFIAGLGIRYQALAWGSIELAVRHREGENLDGATVFVRVNVTGDLRAAAAALAAPAPAPAPR